VAAIRPVDDSIGEFRPSSSWGSTPRRSAGAASTDSGALSAGKRPRDSDKRGSEAVTLFRSPADASHVPRRPSDSTDSDEGPSMRSSAAPRLVKPQEDPNADYNFDEGVALPTRPQQPSAVKFFGGSPVKPQQRLRTAPARGGAVGVVNIPSGTDAPKQQQQQLLHFDTKKVIVDLVRKSAPGPAGIALLGSTLKAMPRSPLLPQNQKEAEVFKEQKVRATLTPAVFTSGAPHVVSNSRSAGPDERLVRAESDSDSDEAALPSTTAGRSRAAISSSGGASPPAFEISEASLGALPPERSLKLPAPALPARPKHPNPDAAPLAIRSTAVRPVTMFQPVSDMVGVRNLGNSCYASSVLSLLLRTPLFVNKLKSFLESELGGSKRYVYEVTPSEPLSTEQAMMTRQTSRSLVVIPVCLVTKALMRLFFELQEGSAEGLRLGCADPTPIARLFANEFFDGEQHDAHEFYVALIARLEDEAITAAACVKADRATRSHKRKFLQGGDSECRSRSSSRDEAANDWSEDDDGGGYDDFHDGTYPSREERHNRREELVKQYLEHGSASRERFVRRAWVNKLLQGSVNTTVRCLRPACRSSQCRAEPFVNVSLGLEHAIVKFAKKESDEFSPLTPQDVEIASVEDLLLHSLAPEMLDDYKCDDCGSSELQEQTCSLGALPKLLVVQLKRYYVVPPSLPGGAWTMQKNKVPICLNPVMHVPLVVASNHQTCGERRGSDADDALTHKKVTYKLHAVVLHQGATLVRGHYTTDFQHHRRASNDSRDVIEGDDLSVVWYHANDAAIFNYGSGNVSRHQSCRVSYMLLYERVSSTKKNRKKKKKRYLELRSDDRSSAEECSD
jgi:hypothetical protein